MATEALESKAPPSKQNVRILDLTVCDGTEDVWKRKRRTTVRIAQVVKDAMEVAMKVIVTGEEWLKMGFTNAAGLS